MAMTSPLMRVRAARTECEYFTDTAFLFSSVLLLDYTVGCQCITFVNNFAS
jgi:hypothetical protein